MLRKLDLRVSTCIFDKDYIGNQMTDCSATFGAGFRLDFVPKY